MESLCFGVPVIGTAVGGIVATIPPDAGLLLPAEPTSEHLVEALASLLEAPERYADIPEAAGAHLLPPKLGLGTT
jgi:glycosyltransferase involved in cell wall biosynthesis